MGGESNSATWQYTETTTNVDSYNTTNSLTSNLSDVGNVAITLPGSSGGSSSLLPIMLVIGVAGALLLFLFRR